VQDSGSAAGETGCSWIAKPLNDDTLYVALAEQRDISMMTAHKRLISQRSADPGLAKRVIFLGASWFEWRPPLALQLVFAVADRHIEKRHALDRACRLTAVGQTQAARVSNLSQTGAGGMAAIDGVGAPGLDQRCGISGGLLR
jgi:hypothetical protein